LILTGNIVGYFEMKIEDTNNVFLDDAFLSKVVSNFSTNPITAPRVLNPQLTFSVERIDSDIVNLLDFTVYFYDNSGLSPWSSPVDVSTIGRYELQEDRSYNFVANLDAISSEAPKIGFHSGNIYWKVYLHADPTDIYKFKDFCLEFDIALSDDGVKKYREIDNQNVEIKYINRRTMKDIED